MTSYQSALGPIKAAPYSADLIIECGKAYVKSIASQFEDPKTICDAKITAVWRAVFACIQCEDRPQMLEAKALNGCNHIYYAQALSSYIDLYFATNSPQGELQQILMRFQMLIKGYIKTSSLMSGIKSVPESASIDYSKELSLLFAKQHAVALNNKQDVLLPLGWVNADTAKGHLLLAKVRPGATTEVKLFNSLYGTSDTVVDICTVNGRKAKVVDLPSSCKITRNEPAETVLQQLYSLLPLQIPNHVKRKVSIKDDNKLQQAATELIYATAKGNTQEVVRPEASALGTTRYIEGNICVPTAFKMLLYTLGMEATLLHAHQSLKSEIDAFFTSFKCHVASIDKLLGTT